MRCSALSEGVHQPQTSQDESPRLRRVSRMISTWLATLCLLVPVVILYNVSNSIGRLAITVVSAGLFLSVLSLFTKAKTVEVFAAGASYAAVLVVFTSTSNNIQYNGNLKADP